MKKLIGFLSLAILWSACGQAGELLESTPANGSVTDKAPTAFVLAFSEKVKLHELYLKRDDEKRWTSVSNLPYREATSFTVPAPSLTKGGYTLEWTVFTENSKALTGRVRFTVSPEQLGSTLSSAH